MKKKTKVLLSSLLAISMSASLATGATYALFTSESTVNVAVTSGTVKVVAGVKDGSLKTYSFEDLQAAGAFENGGTAVYDATTNQLTLDKVTPGDKAVFTIATENKSNVAIQYRVVMHVNGELAKALVATAKIGGVEYAFRGEGTKATVWNKLTANAAIGDIEVSVEFPDRDDNNEFKGKSANISFTVEAVQGNGSTADFVEEVAGGADVDNATDLKDTIADLSTTTAESVNVAVDGYVSFATGARVSSSGDGYIGNEKTQEITFEGAGVDQSFMVATGSGVSATTNPGGVMTFKNMTIVDNSVSYAEDAWEFTYLEFGGQLHFENVKFTSGIMLESDADATFVNCTFESNEDSVYAVWVSDGSASFTNCTFTGTRGLKTHEAYGTEVDTIKVENCTFTDISKKPGIAIGTLNADTTISVKNSKFINCQAGDQGLYMYETDTAVSTFNFVEENNIVCASYTEKEVATANELVALSATALTGNNGKKDIAVIELTADIDMQDADFSAIIAQRGDKLVINGNGHKISNVNVVSGANDNTTGQASMFYAYPNSTLEISNLTLENITVTAEANDTGYAAVVAGYCEGALVLNNVDVVNATVTGVKSSGLLVGHLSGSVVATDCELSGTVTLATNTVEPNGHYAGKYIGTLAGAATLTDCTVDATVTGQLNAANNSESELYGRKTAAGSLTQN